MFGKKLSKRIREVEKEVRQLKCSHQFEDLFIQEIRCGQGESLYLKVASNCLLCGKCKSRLLTKESQMKPYKELLEEIKK